MEIISSINSFLIKTIFTLLNIGLISFALITPVFLPISLFKAALLVALPLSIVLFLITRSLFTKSMLFASNHVLTMFCLFLSSIYLSTKLPKRLITKPKELAIRSGEHLMGNIKNIFISQDDNPIGGFKLFSTYLRLKLKSSLRPSKYLARKPEEIFNFKVNFVDYGEFNYLFTEVFVHKDYEFQTNKKSPFIVDCGSNIGIALLYFKARYPNSKVLAFEPDPDSFPTLEKNVMTNRLKNIVLVNKAVTNLEGHLNFYSHSAGSMCNSLAKAMTPGTQVKRVEATKLSNYINEEVDLLKLDIEGAEQVVMEDLVNEGKLELVDQIIMEFHNQTPLSAMLKLLEDNGFAYQISTHQKPPFFPLPDLGAILIHARRRV